YAGHASEAVVHVVDEGRIEANLTLQAEFHQIDSPARRIHLLAPKGIGGTGGEAKPAMHALVDQISRWRVVRVEGARAAVGRYSRGFRHLDSPNEPAGVQHSRRVELRFDASHQCQRIARASPDIHFRFDFERAAQDDERAPASFQILPQILEYIEKGTGVVPFQPKVADSDRLSDEPPRPLQRFRCFPYQV